MKKKAPSACQALPMHCACRRLQPRRGFSFLSALTSSSSFFFYPQRAEMSRDAINKKKIVTFVFCLIGRRTERGFRQGSQALERSTGGVGGGRSWAARGLHGPPSARRRGMASAARGAAELGASAGQGPPGCTWLRPAPPESAAPARLLGPPGRADRGSSGVCRALYAFRSLAGSLCKPSGVGRTAGGAVGPGSPGAQVIARGLSCRGSPPSVTALRAVAGVSACVRGRTGCSVLTTRVNLGLIGRQGGCRSYEWCSCLLWVKNRGGRRGSFCSRPERGAGASGRRRETLSGRPDPGRRGAGWARTCGDQSPGPTANSCLPAFLLLFVLASFLPSFQSMEMLSRQVRSRSRSRWRLRKTSVALQGVLLAMILAEESSLPHRRATWVGTPGRRAAWLGVRASGTRTSQPGWEPRARGGGDAGGGRFVQNSPGCVADARAGYFNSAHRAGTPGSSWS